MTNGIVSYLAVGVISCGAIGLLATFSLNAQTATRVVGSTAIVALVLAVIALTHRSWTRLPLVAACWCAYVLASATFINPDDDPMAIAALAYAVYGALLLLAGAVTLAIVKLGESRRTSAFVAIDSDGYAYGFENEAAVLRWLEPLSADETEVL